MVKEETKLELIAWLAMLDDQGTIDILKLIKDSQSSDANDLSDISIRAIEEGIQDIEEGRVIPREAFNLKHGL